MSKQIEFQTYDYYVQSNTEYFAIYKNFVENVCGEISVLGAKATYARAAATKRSFAWKNLIGEQTASSRFATRRNAAYERGTDIQWSRSPRAPTNRTTSPRQKHKVGLQLLGPIG